MNERTSWIPVGWMSSLTSFWNNYFSAPLSTRYPGAVSFVVETGDANDPEKPPIKIPIFGVVIAAAILIYLFVRGK